MKNFSPKDYIESVVRTEEELAYLASCLAFCKASPDLRQCLDLTESIARALDEMYPDRPAPAPISFQVPLCSSTPYLHYLNSAFGTNLQTGKFDYIELADVERSAEILLFSALPHPFCRHCNMKNAGRIVPGRSSRSRTEWLMEAKAGDSQCSG